jgi:hypothetical protein
MPLTDLGQQRWRGGRLPTSERFGGNHAISGYRHPAGMLSDPEGRIYVCAWEQWAPSLSAKGGMDWA